MAADTVLLRKIIGDNAASALVQAFGGTTLRVPSSPDTEQARPIIEIIGADSARALIEHYRCDTLYVPKCDKAGALERNRKIIADYLNGFSVHALARAHNLSDRWIWAILKTNPDDCPQQGNLF